MQHGPQLRIGESKYDEKTGTECRGSPSLKPPESTGEQQTATDPPGRNHGQVPRGTRCAAEVDHRQ